MRRKLIAVIIMLAVAVTATALCLSSCVGELGTLDEVETTEPDTPGQDEDDGEPELPSEPSDGEENGDDNGTDDGDADGENGGNDGGNNPEEPTEPDEPDEPAESEEPTEPDEPVEPDEPAEPDEPDEPDEPETPGDEGGEEPPDDTDDGEPTVPEEPEHVHVLLHYSAVAATCTEDGRTEYWHCAECGGYYSDSAAENEISEEEISIPATGHDYEYKVTLPTCTEEGYAEYVCGTCGDRYEEDGSRTEPTGHTFGEWQTVTAATCLHGGEMKRECEVCGASETEYTDKLEHEYGETIVVTPSTCLEEGEVVRYCTDCGGSITERLPIASHEYESETILPTCTENGYTLYKCIWCGDGYRDDETEVLGHSYGEWETVVAAGCESVGEEVRTCGRCGNVETRETEPLGHEYEAEIVEPACTEGGYTLYECVRCGDGYRDDETEALGHSYGEWETVSPAECESGGEEIRTCGRCGNVEMRETEPLGHDYEAEIVEPTCTENGYTLHKCGLCGHTYKDNATEPLGHNYGEWTVTVPAECESAGEEIRTCGRCGNVEMRETEPLGHDYEAEIVEPTCTEGGYTLYSCGLCGHTYKDNATEPLGHDYEVTETEGTVDSPSVKHYKCRRCGYEYTEEGESLPATSGIIYELSESGAYYSVTGIEAGIYADELIIPDEYNGLPVCEIADGAFEGNADIVSVQMGAGLHRIGERAFADCINLKTVNIPEEVADIGGEAFSGCLSLALVEYQAADADSNDTNIFSGAGNGGDGITLYVAESVLSLPANLFFVIGAASLHPNLTAIEIAENSRLEEIGEGAFKECLKLKEVSLPASVKKICAEAFYGCSALVKAVVPSAADIDGTAFEDVSKKFELVIF